MNKILQILLLLNISISVYAQSDNDKLVQFSGVVVTSDDLQPIPYTSVIIKHTYRGTITDFYGFFSFVALKGDTVEFSYLGYKKSFYVIPDTLKESRYSLIQMLSRDTILLKETVIYPWPSKEEFKKAFVELNIPDDDAQRAMRNLEMAQHKEIQDNVPYDGSINYKFLNRERNYQLYTAGQYPVNNLLNPLAWAAFVKAWQEGAYKKKDDK